MSERFLETFQLLVLLSEGHLATRMCPLSPNSFVSWLGMGPLEAKLSSGRGRSLSWATIRAVVEVLLRACADKDLWDNYPLAGVDSLMCPP